MRMLIMAVLIVAGLMAAGYGVWAHVRFGQLIDHGGRMADWARPWPYPDQPLQSYMAWRAGTWGAPNPARLAGEMAWVIRSFIGLGAVVFVGGAVLMFVGPRERDPTSET